MEIVELALTDLKSQPGQSQLQLVLQCPKAAAGLTVRDYKPINRETHRTMSLSRNYLEQACCILCDLILQECWDAILASTSYP